jgi:hypothetical protein
MEKEILKWIINIDRCVCGLNPGQIAAVVSKVMNTKSVGSVKKDFGT